METLLVGGFIRFAQGLAAAAPTLLIGLFVAAVLRYYLGGEGTRRFFGGESLISLPQSWLIGMLLPVCSVGVLPILREMKRVGVRPGAITAFALAAPLFNPLSILYGLTLSRPMVIIGFAFASLAVVTVLGLVWDHFGKAKQSSADSPEKPIIGLRRLGACMIFASRELCGPTGGLTLIALLGLLLLGMVLPHGALQSSVEQDDPLAPARMALVALPIYATPMLAMSQLGMMFAHGNSPGAAFCLLLLGTGMNLATFVWIAHNYGIRNTCLWLATLLAIVLALAYAVDKPLIPPGVEPAGHTHAFDIYTNPLHSGATLTIAKVRQELEKTIGLADKLALLMACLVLALGAVFRIALANWVQAFLSAEQRPLEATSGGFDRIVSPRLVAVICIMGLVAFSIVGCYAYYPSPKETLEEMRIARTEVLTGASGGDYKAALLWIPVLDEWSRRLEVGAAIRNFELRPYQHTQAHLLREKLELLEHEIEHAMELSTEEQARLRLLDEADEPQSSQAGGPVVDNPIAEIRQLVSRISQNSLRLNAAFSR